MSRYTFEIVEFENGDFVVMVSTAYQIGYVSSRNGFFCTMLKDARRFKFKHDAEHEARKVQKELDKIKSSTTIKAIHLIN